MYYTIYKCDFASIILAGDEAGLAVLAFDVKKAKKKAEISPQWQQNDEHFADVKDQLDEYFAGSRKSFDLQLNPAGTEYQKRVWQQLGSIPYGQTRSYRDIAVAMGEPNSSRAVGAANGKNPIAIIVPCHRVVGSDDSLTGYAYGLDIKRRLLNLEKQHM